MSDELTQLLELERLDRDLYRGVNVGHANGRGHLYGGQVAAQALRAAAHTVPAGRMPHSLHGYFLRPGRNDISTLFRVDNDRDGGSVSARRVVAIQDGDVIFSLSASFQEVEEGPDFQAASSEGVGSPDDLPDRPINPSGPIGMFETRIVVGRLGAHGHEIPEVYWARARSPLPDDPVLHACILTYLSDMGTGLVNVLVESGLAGPSIDHATWFHRHIRLDEWVLFTMKPISASHNRGLYWGSLQSQDGTLGATMIQESLFRPLRRESPPPG
jgi:acyl-CoA thioesterase-2